IRPALGRLHDGAGRVGGALRGDGEGRRDLSRGHPMTEARRPDAVPAEHRATAPRSIGCYVLTISHSKTPETDTSGILIRELLIAAGHTIVGHAVVKDEPTQVVATIRQGCADPNLHAFVLTGGTGVTSRDSTFEAVESLLDKRLTGFGELFRMLSYQE